MSNEQQAAFLAGLTAGACAAGGSAQRGVTVSPKMIERTVLAVAQEWGLDPEAVGQALDEHWERLRHSAFWSARWDVARE